LSADGSDGQFAHQQVDSSRVNLDCLYRSAHQQWLKVASYCFDFREFWHWPIVRVKRLQLEVSLNTLALWGIARILPNSLRVLAFASVLTFSRRWSDPINLARAGTTARRDGPDVNSC
jgi:hypothetical protein